MTDKPTNSPADKSLLQGLEELEKLEDQRAEINLGIKTILDDLKSAGHPPKVVKQILALMRLDEAKREEAREQRELLESYADALEL